MAGAQAFILRELQTEFGGSARAAGETFGGQLEILKNKLGNMKEEIGGRLLPILTGLAERFNSLLNSEAVRAMFQGLLDWIDKAAAWFGEKFLPAVDNFINVTLPKWAEGFETAKQVFSEFLGVILGGQDPFAAAMNNNAIAAEDFGLRHKSALSEAMGNSEWFNVSTLQGISKLVTAWDEFKTAIGAIFEYFGLVTAGGADDFSIFGYVIDSVISMVTSKIDTLTMQIYSAIASIEMLKSVLNSFPAPDFPDAAAGQGFASGGSFTVPSGFSGDSFPMRVSSGEQVSVTPPGQARSGGMSDQQLKTLAKYIGMEVAKAVG